MKTISYVRTDLLKKAIRSYSKAEIEIYEDQESIKDTRFHLGINWAACGTQKPADTRKFAVRLERIANLADKINELDLTIAYGEDDEINTKEAYQETYKGLMNMIETGSWGLLELFIKKSAKEA
ncbi:MAG: hypothetical protein ACI4CX_09630 [Candidatus Weimeria sp.]